MRSAHILLLCMLGAALLSSVLSSNAITPDNCCFQFYPKRLDKKLVREYSVTDERCPKRGIILVLKKGRRVCVDLSAPWVEGIMRHVDENY
ncbi:C-C motif chemokine 36.1 [Cheilinus undulatus]|uniref:C-C motif chemokine 36.1 n=1 Tax=Cheilinus undulatus TaxID=241271 RepID=UPI001BD20C6E|nr:C-C motif chemokine 36.1 [Cheilinus undulatus]